MEFYVYHATLESNLKSILENGLKKNKIADYASDYFTEGCTFFTFLSAQEAYDIVESMVDDAQKENEEEIVVLKVPLSALNMTKIKWDWNLKVENPDEIKYFAYTEDIPADTVSIVPKEEYENTYTTFEDLRITDDDTYDLYCKLLDFFEENIGYEQE